MQQLWRPAIDMVETEDTLQVLMNLAGVDRESVDVDFFNNIVSIKGERVTPTLASADGATQLRQEIVYGKFERKIVLPISITQKESVSINMSNGVLTVVIDKTAENRNKFSLKVEPAEKKERGV
jgi:HSP20 family protein